MRTVGSVSSLSIANVSGRASYILQSCNFYQLVNLHERFFGRMQAWTETYKKFSIFGGVGFSRAKYYTNFPECNAQECCRKDSAKELFHDRFVRFCEGKKHKLHRSEAEVLLIFTNFRVVFQRL